MLEDRVFSSPTSPQLKIVLIGEDYGLEASIRKNKGRDISDPASMIYVLGITLLVIHVVVKCHSACHARCLGGIVPHLSDI